MNQETQCAATDGPPSDVSSIELTQDLREIRKLITAVAGMIHRLGSPYSRRHHISGALYHLSFEHCGSIVQLVSLGRTGSAMALVRPAFEAYLRAAWAHYCADNKQLEGIAKRGAQFPGAQHMSSELSRSPSHEAHGTVTAINGFIPASIRHGLTHGGIEQIAARLDGKSVRANFMPEAVIGALRTAAGIAAVSAMGMARNCGREDVAEHIAQVFLEVVRSTSPCSGVQPPEDHR